MVTPYDMLAELEFAHQELSLRLSITDDDAEKAIIGRLLHKTDRYIDKVILAGLRDAAGMVADTADDLMEVVCSAQTDLLNGYIVNLSRILGRLRIQVENALNEETDQERDYPKTEDPETEISLPPPKPEPEPPDHVPPWDSAPNPVPPAAPPDPAKPEPANPPPLPPVTNSTKFSVLKDEYKAAWANCRIRDDKRPQINKALSKLKRYQDQYESVAQVFGGMPWYFIGIIHGLESYFNFKCHLHNGDPLKARTVRVPKGRPQSGQPPFSWEFSAKDAMVHMGYDRIDDWSRPYLLYLWEKYNGFGYRYKGRRTPYLWSYSNLYEKGRYVADHVFDPNSVCQQCGAATLLKALEE